MEEKRLYILQNVGQLYMRYGIKSVTMDDVAREFGISKKTLYQFFNDKKDLVSQAMEFFAKSLADEFHFEAGENPIDSIIDLRRHVTTVLRHFNNNLEFDLKKLYPGLDNRMKVFKREKIYNNTKSNLEAGIEQGYYRKEIDVDFIARLQVGNMLLTMNANTGIFEEQEVSSIEFFDKAMDYHLHGICTEKGLEYYKKQLNNIQNETQN